MPDTPDLDPNVPLGRTGKPMRKNSAVVRLQAAAMLRDAAAGMKRGDIARKYHTSLDTVERRLSYAQRASLFTKAEDTILEGMVPLAQKALLNRLEKEAADGFDEKPEVSLEIFKGTRLLKRDAGKTPSQLIPGGEESLDTYIARLRLQAADDLNTVDGTILPGERSVAGLLASPEGAAPGEPPAGAGPDGESPDGPDGDPEEERRATPLEGGREAGDAVTLVDAERFGEDE